MFDRANLLLVSDAVFGVDKATNRLNTAKQQLEIAKSAVDAARGEIETAKEGVSTAKAGLDTVLATFESTGHSKTTIIKAAEDINRIFGDMGLTASAEEGATPEVDLPKASAKKVADALRELVEKVGELDLAAEIVTSAEAILLMVEAAAAGGKDESEASKPKRKRRSKNDDADTNEASSAQTAPITAEVAATEPTTEEPVAAEVVTPEVVAETETAAASVPVEVEEAVIADEAPADVIAEVAASEETVEVVSEVPAAASIAEDVVNSEKEFLARNEEVRDELLDLIDVNVVADDLNGIVMSAAVAVHLAANDKGEVLSFEKLVNGMTVENLVAMEGAPFLNAEMQGNIAHLIREKDYVGKVLTWFVSGIADIENGKEMPAFNAEEAQVSEEATAVEDVTIAEPVEEVTVAAEVEDDTTVVEAEIVADDETIDAVEVQIDEHAEVAPEMEIEEDEAADVEPVVEETAAEETAVVEEKPEPAASPSTPPAPPAPGLKRPPFLRPSFPAKS